MNELDKIFRSKLENHTEEYSSQAWDNIQNRLMKQKTKPKKFPWVWMSLVPLIIGGLAFLLVSYSDSSSQTSSLSDATISKSQGLDQKQDEQSAKILASETTKETTKALNENSISDIENTYDKNQSDQLIKNTNIEKNDSDVAIATDSKGSTIESSTFENQLKNNSISQSIEVLEQSTEEIVQHTDQNEFESSEISNKNTSTIDAVAVMNNGLDITNKSSEENLDRLIDIRPLRTIGVSSFTKLFSVKEQEDIELTKSLMDDFRQDCPSFVTDRTGVYLDFYLSHELPFSSLTAKDAQSEPYQTLRAETEGPSYSISAGARLTLMLPNGLGLKTGINYSQVNEKFSYIDPESVMNKQVITITTVDGMEIRDTNYIEIPGTREIVSTNKYRSFDLPLLLSYEWDVRERTYMTVNGGVYLNLLFKESGKILDSGGEVIELGDGTGDGLAIFKNNIGLSLFGSVGLHYRWNSSIDFILEPNVRVLVKSATVEGQPISHKWFTGGLITGMRYNF